MPAYAIAHMTEVRMGPEIVRYMEQVDATLEPFDGRFLVHGDNDLAVMDGEWQGVVVIVEFPTREQADAWYASEAYQAILALRTENSEGGAVIVDGVAPGYRASSYAAAAAAAA
jgi:uncharacterized protein (DUF1330 family)